MNRRVRVDRERLAWAGGIFEDEGCISKTNGNRKNFHLRISVKNTDKELLIRFHKAIGGLGSVDTPRKLKNRKPIMQWSASKFESVQAVIATLWPWLLTRRRDKYKKLLKAFLNRKVPIRGSWICKLSMPKARKIRKVYQSGKYSGIELANKYDVGRSTVYEIINDKTYKEVQI